MNLGFATTLADGKLTYHSTVVCEALPDNKTRLNSGGWRTATTKKRMNQYAEMMGHEWRVYQKDYEWRVDYNGTNLKFHDRMVIDAKMFGGDK
jgi:hypothetical protein